MRSQPVLYFQSELPIIPSFGPFHQSCLEVAVRHMPLNILSTRVAHRGWTTARITLIRSAMNSTLIQMLDNGCIGFYGKMFSARL